MTVKLSRLRTACLCWGAALAIAAGCSDDGMQGGGSGGATAVVAGTGGGVAAAGTGGSSGGGSGGAGVAVSWATCEAPTKEGVSAADFCERYQETCSFAPGDSSFADTTACVARYNSYVTSARDASQKGCAAYYLCMAGMSGMAATYCAAPAQAAGPCMLPPRPR
jgi:hypothetical protein